MDGNTKARGGRFGRTVIVAALLLGTLSVQALAVEPPTSRKMARQIEVMEKILDQVLLDSPNFLIRGTPVARGTYIDGFGVLFTFDASILDHDLDLDFKNWDFGGFRVEEHDGKRVIILPDQGREEDHESTNDNDNEDDIRTWRDRRNARSDRVYVRGKTEIVDLLLDYGDTLTTLDAEQWIAVMAFMTDEDFADRSRFSRLILKAKVADLRAYAADDLSEEEMVKRIVEEEY